MEHTEPSHDDLLRAVEKAKQDHHRAIIELGDVQQQEAEKARSDRQRERPPLGDAPPAADPLDDLIAQDGEGEGDASCYCGDTDIHYDSHDPDPPTHDPEEVARWSVRPPPMGALGVPFALRRPLFRAERTLVALHRAKLDLAVFEFRAAHGCDPCASDDADWGWGAAGMKVYDLRVAIGRGRLADHPDGL